MRCAKALVTTAGGAALEALDMRRAISAATTMKPTTISRPITMTRTFSHSGAPTWAEAAWEEGAWEEEGGAKLTP